MEPDQEAIAAVATVDFDAMLTGRLRWTVAEFRAVSALLVPAWLLTSPFPEDIMQRALLRLRAGG